MLSRRDKSLKWMRRKNPSNYALIESSIDGLIGILNSKKYSMPNRSSDDIPVSANDLYFEKAYCEDKFSYIGITFSNDGELGFSVYFGVCRYEPPHKCLRAGSLLYHRFTFGNRFGFGVNFLSIRKAEKFRRDWQYVLSRIGDIENFLDNGIKSKGIYVSEIHPDLQIIDEAKKGDAQD